MSGARQPVGTRSSSRLCANLASEGSLAGSRKLVPDETSKSMVKYQFYKMIVNPRVQLFAMRLPRIFIARHGELLPDKVKLIIPDGTQWIVQVSREIDAHDVWLKNGWEKFVEYYSVSLGHILHFQCESSFELTVKIFDTNCCEIKYKQVSKKAAVQQIDSPLLLDDDSDPDYMSEEDDSDDHDGTSEEDYIPSTLPLVPVRKRPMSSHSKAIVPASRFTILMKKSYVSQIYLAAVPAYGKTPYLTGNEEENKPAGREIYLYDSDENEYTVSSYFDTTKRQVRLNMRGFVMAKRVREGDACTFDLIQGTNELI